MTFSPFKLNRSASPVSMQTLEEELYVPDLPLRELFKATVVHAEGKVMTNDSNWYQVTLKLATEGCRYRAGDDKVVDAKGKEVRSMRYTLCIPMDSGALDYNGNRRSGIFMIRNSYMFLIALGIIAHKDEFWDNIENALSGDGFPNLVGRSLLVKRDYKKDYIHRTEDKQYTIYTRDGKPHTDYEDVTFEDRKAAALDYNKRFRKDISSSYPEIVEMQCLTAAQPKTSAPAEVSEPVEVAVNADYE